MTSINLERSPEFYSTRSRTPDGRRYYCDDKTGKFYIEDTIPDDFGNFWIYLKTDITYMEISKEDLVEALI